jgi:hypothetical protein
MSTGSRVVILMGQLYGLALCIFMLAYVSKETIFPDKQVINNYSRTNSFIINKRLSVYQGLTRQYRADFLISYNVNGVQYNRWVSANGLDTSFDADRHRQEIALSKFHLGGTYPGWYNPSDPQSVVLVLRHNWQSTMSLIAPALFAVMFLYLILNELLLLITGASWKIRSI